MHKLKISSIKLVISNHGNIFFLIYVIEFNQRIECRDNKPVSCLGFELLGSDLSEFHKILASDNQQVAYTLP